jgi:hypothetical protein
MPSLKLTRLRINYPCPSKKEKTLNTQGASLLFHNTCGEPVENHVHNGVKASTKEPFNTLPIF